MQCFISSCQQAVAAGIDLFMSIKEANGGGACDVRSTARISVERNVYAASSITDIVSRLPSIGYGSA